MAWACLWLIASLGLHSALAQSADETAVKAVFLLRFGSFVDWPPSAFEAASSPLVICVAGDAGLAKTVEQAAQGEHVASRPIVAKRIDGDLPKEGCHVVYAGGSGAHNTAEILEHFRGMPVLTVTDADYGTARGIIHFVLSDRRVRFRIDRSEAERNGLRMNARLLQIALSVDVSDARSGP